MLSSRAQQRIIAMYGVFQNRDDQHTFISMNDLYFKYYNEYPKTNVLVTDLGIYDKIINMKHNMINYIKFQQWQGESN